MPSIPVRFPVRLRPVVASIAALLVTAVLLPVPAVGPMAAATTTDAPAMTLDREPLVVQTARPTPDASGAPGPEAPESPPGSTTTLSQPERSSDIDPGTVPATASSEPGLEPFQLIGLASDEPPTGPVSVRVLEDDGWSEWIELVFDDNHGPDPGTGEGQPTAVSEPVWVGAATAYEVRGDEHLLDPAEVLLVREDPTATVPVTQGQTAPRISSGQPTIYSRASWGARPFRGSPLHADELKVAYVHHTVSANDYTSAAVPGILRSIQAYHMDSNGWNDIAYNFLVDRFGRIWEGRQGSVDNIVIGGHAKGFNTGTVGVAAIGDFTASSPWAMRDAIGKVIGWKLFLHGVNPSGSVAFTSQGSTLYPAGTVITLPRIVGHRHTSSTGCPGNHLYANLGQVLSTAVNTHSQQVGIGSFSSRAVSIAEDGTPLVGDFTGDGNSDVLVYGAGAAQDSLWLGTDAGTLSFRPMSVKGTYEPFVADFNGDYRDDIFWYGPGSAYDVLWLGQTNGTFTGRAVSVNGSYEPVVGDFDDDDADDILWYGPGSAYDSLWLGRPSGHAHRPVTVNGTYSPQVGDFDGDQHDDVFWYSAGSALDVLWLGRDDGAWSSRHYRVNGTYRPVVGDWNGDHRDDLIWYAPGLSGDSSWIATGGGYFRHLPVNINGTYQPLVADFNGGGYEDVFWYAAGGATDVLWKGTPAGSFSSIHHSVNGTYDARTMNLGVDGRGDILWYGPGLAYDSIWLGKG